mgnify:CR=1 FL=1
MKTNRIIRLLLPCALGILLAACVQEDIGSDTGTLPEGMYAVEIFAVQEAENGGIQTRVTDPPGNNRSQWSDGDKIFVKMYAEDDPNTVIATGEYSYDESTKKFIAVEKKGLYWPEPNKTYNFTGWYYPNNLDNADGKKEYDLKNSTYIMYGEGNGQYGNPLTMIFSHKLAKVRVKLQNSSTTGELSVSVWGHKKFKVNGSELSGSSWGLISMKKMDDGSFEANVVPETYESMEFEIHQKNGDETTVATAKQSTESKLNAGIIYPYTIDIRGNTEWVKEHDLKNKLEADITEDIILYYTYVPSAYAQSASPNTIKVANGVGVTITIRDLKIGYKSANPSIWDMDVPVNGPIMTIGEGAKVTLKVKGEENLFYPTEGGAGIEMKNGSSLTIVGDGRENSKLSIITQAGTETKGCPCIGSAYTESGSVELEGITIQDVTLDLTQGGKYGYYSSAAIGLAHSHEQSRNQSCKSIKIENSDVKIVNRGDGACIGTGVLESAGKTRSFSYNIDQISITNSLIDAEAQHGACIGFGRRATEAKIDGTIGKIFIDNNTTLKLRAQGSLAGFKDGYTVGCGKISETASSEPTITNGIFFGEQRMDIGTDSGRGWNPPQP